MKSRRTAALVLLLAVMSVRGEGDGPGAPPDARILRVEPDGVTFRHAVGVSKIPFEELPAEYAARFGYHPEASAVYRAGVRLAEREWSVAQLTAQRREREARADRLQQIREKELTAELERTLKRTSAYYRLHIIGDTGDGWLAFPSVPVTTQGGPLARNRRSWDGLGQAMVVTDLPAKARERGRWTGRLYYAGSDSFTDRCGNPRSTPRYSTSPETAATALLSETGW